MTAGRRSSRSLQDDAGKQLLTHQSDGAYRNPITRSTSDTLGSISKGRFAYRGAGSISWWYFTRIPGILEQVAGQHCRDGVVWTDYSFRTKLSRSGNARGTCRLAADARRVDHRLRLQNLV